MRRPIMSTPEQLASLEGQQYVVLRPGGAVARLYETEQRKALQLADLPHPHTGHVTLRGFSEPEGYEAVAALVREWASEQHPIDVSVEAVDVFPEPWQIVILRLTRAASLVDAYATLTSTLEPTDFRRLGELAVEDWTFHLSVVYGKALAPTAWDGIAQASRRDLATPASVTIDEVEFVSYRDGVEHVEVMPLGRHDY